MKPNQRWLDHTIYGIRIALKYRTSHILRDNAVFKLIKAVLLYKLFSRMVVKRGEFSLNVEI